MKQLSITCLYSKRKMATHQLTRWSRIHEYNNTEITIRWIGYYQQLIEQIDAEIDRRAELIPLPIILQLIVSGQKFTVK